jgi:hypothetical protein
MSQAGQAGSGSGPSSSFEAYPFVVGATGNYPATVTGLQDAITAASAAAGGGGNAYTVFIQVPGVDDGGSGTPIIVPPGAILMGAENERPANAIINNGGNIVMPALATNTAQTLLNVVFNFGLDGGNFSFYNIAWSSSTYFGPYFNIPDGSVTRNYYIKNSFIQGAVDIGPTMIFPEIHTTGATFVNIYCENSVIDCSTNGIMMQLFNSAGGSITLNMYVSDNSVIGTGFGINSSFVGPNVGFFLVLASGSWYLNGLDAENTTDFTNCFVSYNLTDANVGMSQLVPFFKADGVFSNVLLNQTYTNWWGMQGQNVPVFSQIGGITLQYAGSQDYSPGVTIQNAFFCDTPSISQTILTSCSQIFAAGDFTPTLLFGGGNTGQTGTYQGSYVRNGRQVDIQILITLTAVGSSTGQASIGNLPFLANDFGTAAQSKLLPTYLEQVTATGITYSSFASIISPGNAALSAIYEFPASGALNKVALSNTAFTNTSIINICGTYWTD